MYPLLSQSPSCRAVPCPHFPCINMNIKLIRGVCYIETGNGDRTSAKKKNIYMSVFVFVCVCSYLSSASKQHDMIDISSSPLPTLCRHKQ